MFITPNANIRLLKNIPFNSDRKHTMLFGTKTQQFQFFSGRTKYLCTRFTYVRHSQSIKVPYNAELLYDCNYCMFQNNAFGDKWFYAFITSVEYINNTTSEVFLEMDNFQSWWFDVTLGKCFVEREHVADDTVGAHTVSEPVNIGENTVCSVTNFYLGNGATFVNNNWMVQLLGKPSLVQGLIGQWKTEKQGNQLVSTQYSFDLSQDVENLNTWLNEEALVGTEIVNMTMYPKFFETQDGNLMYKLNEQGITRPTSFAFVNESTTTGYTPRNNKLLTFPYTFLRVDNHEGQTVDFKWENMSSNGLQFNVRGYVGNGVSCELRPIGYETLGSNRQYTIAINNFPEVSFIQNTSLNNIMKTVAGLAGDVVSAISYSTNSSNGLSKVASDSASSTSSLTSSTQYPLQKGKKAKHTTLTKGQYNTQRQAETSTENESTTSGFNPLALANTPLNLLGTLGESSTRVNGGTQGNLDIRWNTFGFSFYTMGIKPEYAKLIDDYFDRFGYEVDEFKVPTLTSRPSFNFVKTVDCNIVGDIPNEAMTEIATMFDSGLTLWHTANVGNYSLNNAIVKHN